MSTISAKTIDLGVLRKMPGFKNFQPASRKSNRIASKLLIHRRPLQLHRTVATTEMFVLKIQFILCFSVRPELEWPSR